MLGEVEAKCGLFTVTAKPKARWRRALDDFIPYVQGQKVDFEITVTATTNTIGDSILAYSIENTGGLLSWVNDITLSSMKTGESVKRDSVKLPLYRSGDSLFTVWTLDAIERRQAAYIFHTSSRNNIFLAILGIAITVLAAIITVA